MELRRATPADGDAVAAVFVAARGGMTYLPPLDVEGASEFFRGRVVCELETWVALEDRAVVGFATVDEGDLDHLYVAPAAQGQGVGTALLDLVKALRPDGFELWVFQRNEGARRFYERHGCVLLRETDGSRNMEREPDARYGWLGQAGRPEA
jgi:ribosomal protein S18 acetylase RimI-like enzyme